MVHSNYTITRGIIVSKEEILKILFGTNSNMNYSNLTDDDISLYVSEYSYENMRTMPFKFYNLKLYNKTINKYIILGNQEQHMDNLPHQFGMGLFRSYNEYFNNKNIDIKDITDNHIQSFITYNNSDKKINIELQKKYDAWSFYDKDILEYAEKNGITNTKMECHYTEY